MTRKDEGEGRGGLHCAALRCGGAEPRSACGWMMPTVSVSLHWMEEGALVPTTRPWDHVRSRLALLAARGGEKAAGGANDEQFEGSAIVWLVRHFWHGMACALLLSTAGQARCGLRRLAAGGGGRPNLGSAGMPQPQHALLLHGGATTPVVPYPVSPRRCVYLCVRAA